MMWPAGGAAEGTRMQTAWLQMSLRNTVTRMQTACPVRDDKRSDVVYMARNWRGRGTGGRRLHMHELRH